MHLELTRDPAAFLAGAREHLAADPVLTTVVATLAERNARRSDDAHEDDWWATVRDEGGRVVGVAMCTARFAPRPAYVLPMPDEAAVLLARTLHERGEELTQVNGALPAALVLLGELGRLTGRRAEIGQHSRLFELRTVVAPRPVPGRLRAALPDDADLVEAWFTAFFDDADEQAGRPPREHEGHVEPDDILRRIQDGRVWLWEDADGRVVHLSGANPPAFGAARIGPVYTPREQRGRGWASAAVAALSQRILDAGARPCLFTDQANPTSNAIYQALGYQAVVDTADVVLV